MNADRSSSTEWISVIEELDVVLVRAAVRRLGGAMGLSRVGIEALATASSEISTNIVTHAGGGHVCVEGVAGAHRRGVVVTARDEGPGIAELERAFEDGYSTSGGLGLGLCGARRLVDDFELESLPGRGTVIVLRKWRP
jgi:serine/threonine-protein kinase RsbT